jgi:hypothetical protein
MTIRLVAASVLALAVAAAQSGTTARAKPSDYPVQVQAGDMTLAGEYMVRSVGSGDAMFIVPDHLVVEVAVYPPKGSTLEVSAGHFTLRINGNKRPLLAQPPSMAAAALKYPDWGWRPQVIGSAGVGDGDVVIGRPRRVERFPGDRRPSDTRPPIGAHKEQAPEKPPEEVVVEAALPEGPTGGPISGYLYFASKEKPKKIKSLELLYNNGAVQAVLKFF